MKKVYILLLFIMMSAVAFSQTGSITGTVGTAESGEAAVGAVVRLEGTSFGSVTDLNGMFTINDVPVGDYTLTVSSVGYDPINQEVTVEEGTNDVGSLSLSGGSLAIQGVEIIADIAIDRKTPVAVSNVSG